MLKVAICHDDKAICSQIEDTRWLSMALEGYLHSLINNIDGGIGKNHLKMVLDDLETVHPWVLF